MTITRFYFLKKLLTDMQNRQKQLAEQKRNSFPEHRGHREGNSRESEPLERKNDGEGY